MSDWRAAAMILLTAAGAFPAPLNGKTVEYSIETAAGSDDVGDGGSALAASLGAVEGLALDAAGNLFISDNLDHRIRRVDVHTGRIDTIAGNGHPGFAGDGGRASAAQIRHPYGVAAGRDGALFVADYGNRRVRRISPDGFIGTVAGGGGDSPARRLVLLGPRNVATGPDGEIYISDFDGHRIYRVTPSGQASSVAGTGIAGYNGDGSAAHTHLNGPAGLALADDGALYFADTGNGRIRKLLRGEVTTVLGGVPDELTLFQPTGVALDGAGSLFVADSAVRQVYRMTPLGEARPILPEVPGLDAVRDVAVQWWTYFAGGRRVFMTGGGGQATPVAGSGEFGYDGDGIPAVSARLDGPISVALDAGGNLLIVEEGRRRLRRVDAEGLISTLAGAASEDDDPPSEETLLDPAAVATDAAGRIWVADHWGHRVRRIDFAGTMHTVAGDGEPGFSGDGGPAYRARLNRPRGLAADEFGNLYIADSGNHCIRRIAPDGLIHTYAGNGARGYSGDRGLANRASLDTPGGVAADRDGSLYIADTGNHAIRKIREDGVILTIAGTGLAGFDGDRGPAAAARLHSPAAVAVDALGYVWIADTGNHRIRRIAPDGSIETVAGAGQAGFFGDGGPARAARLSSPSGLAVSADGSVWVADLGNRRVRRLTPVIEVPDVVPVGECSVVHAAAFRAGPIAPGQIASLFGEGVGPAEPLLGGLDEYGAVATEAGGVQVRLDGVPAPLFFAGPNQINFQAPYMEAAGAARVEVFVSGELRGVCAVEFAEAAPGLFTAGGGSGQVVAVHEDGSVNAPENPAPRGSIVTLFATGEGRTDPPGAAGRLAAPPLPKPVLPVHLRIGGLPAEILYAGAAPGYAGLMQINARIPDGFAPTGGLALELHVGGARSQPDVRIWVR